jgi:hypothetical protein
MVSVDDVPSGLACGCVCIVCKRPLVAKKGRVQSHHFAHRAGEFDPDCERVGETLLHRYAKDVLSREKQILLPSVSGADEWGPLEVFREGLVAFDSVELERRFGDVIPDVVGHLRSRDLFIEFKVTHACPYEKLQKLKRLDVGVLEIDLSLYREKRLDELDDIIIRHAPRKTLQSRAIDGLPKALAERSRRLRKSLPLDLDDFAREMAARRPATLGGTLLFDISDATSRDHILAHESTAMNFFSVAGAEWKAWVLMEMRSRGWLAPFDLVSSMPHSFTIPGYREMDARLAYYAREYEGLRLFTCTETVKDFLEAMVDRGYLSGNDRGRFHIVRDHDQSADVYERSVVIISAIMTMLDIGMEHFDHRAWFGDACRGRASLGRSNLVPEERRALERDLVVLARQVAEEGRLPTNDLGLSQHISLPAANWPAG